MLAYVLKRLLAAVPTFVGITTVTFAVMHAAPGDPLTAGWEEASTGDATTSTNDRLLRHFDLDKPLHIQYASWFSRVVRLDFGQSFTDHRPVWEKIRERLPWTVGVSLASIFLGLCIALPAGTRAAAKPGGWFDHAFAIATYVLYSIPAYVLAMLLIAWVAGGSIDWLPTSNAYSDDFATLAPAAKVLDILKHALLITICFTAPALAFQSRFIRANVLEAMSANYVRTARAKGLPERRVIRKHALRNALIPMLTYLGLLLPTVISGSAILEVMFNWPGIGRLMYEAILQRDYPTVMAVTVIAAILVQIGTLLADISYVWADPRVRDAHGATDGI